VRRQVRWGAPKADRWGCASRASKCGRFKVLTHRTASPGNGFWNGRAYELQDGEGRQIGTRWHDTLAEALDQAEWENDPSWEPDG